MSRYFGTERCSGEQRFGRFWRLRSKPEKLAETGRRFDDKILTCIDPAAADRVWKGGRYGYGQLLLLVDQDLLLVLSEKGDIALVDAKPEGYKELARLHALDGKTWNHPVVAHGKLLVRNAEEAVCYELPLEAI